MSDETNNVNDTDYFVSYELNNSGNKIAIYLPFKDDNLPIAKAIIKVCSLFSDSVNGEPAEEKKSTPAKSEANILVICTKDERHVIIKHPDCYWVETKELSIDQLVDPSNKATKFSRIVEAVYKQLMVALSHK